MIYWVVNEQFNSKCSAFTYSADGYEILFLISPKSGLNVSFEFYPLKTDSKTMSSLAFPEKKYDKWNSFVCIFSMHYAEAIILIAKMVVLSATISRKHTYSNIQKISPPKTEKYSDKNSDIFYISAQNIDFGYSLEPPRRGGSNEYPQFMFWAEIRKIIFTPVNPSFTIHKWGLWESKLYRYVFVMIRTTVAEGF